MLRRNTNNTRSNRRALASSLLVGCALIMALAGCEHGEAADGPSQGKGGAHGQSAQSPSRKGSAPQAYSDSAPGDGYAGPLSIAPSPQSMATTQDLRVETADLKHAEQEALKINQEAGGTIQQQNERDATGATDEAEAFYGDVTLVLSIPTDRFEGAVARLKSLGDIKFSNVNTTNVTQQITDVAVEIESVQQTIDRLQQLQAQITDPDAVVRLQSQLSAQRTRLIELHRQQQGTERRVQTATLTVTLLGKKPVEPQRNWVSAGLYSGWAALVATAKWVVTAVSWLAVWLAPVVVVLVALRVSWRLARRRRV